MMLSEINESDSSPKKEAHDVQSSEMEQRHDDDDNFETAPYQTLAMQTNISMEPQ